MRFLHNGTPASWTVTRHLTYHLVPSTGGSGTSWQIDNWRIEPTQDDLRDEATGQPIDG